jgi:hypothetical protein
MKRPTANPPPAPAPEPIVRDSEGKIISPLPEIESLRLPSGFSLASLWDPFIARVRTLLNRPAQPH